MSASIFKARARFFVNLLTTVIMIFTASFAGTPAVKALPEVSSHSPAVVANLTRNQVYSETWPLGSSVTVTIDDASNGPGIDFTDSGVVGEAPWGNPDFTWVEFFPDTLELEPGDIVTLSGNSISKELIIEPLEILGFDLDLDTVAGTAEPGDTVAVFSMGGRRDATTNLNGEWEVNFSIAGNQPFEQVIIDLTPGTNIGVDLFDMDGDYTETELRIPNPRILTRANDDRIEGFDWAIGSTITIDIDDPLTAQAPDKTVYAVGSTAPWNPAELWFEIQLNDYDLKPGDIVTAIEGTNQKQLTIEYLLITDYDLDTEIVYGTADPGQLIYIQACDDVSCANRDETADLNGNWAVNFAVAGEQGWEQDTKDIQDGTWIDANINDEDGDMSRFGISISSPNIIARLTLNQVDADGWPIGTLLTITVEDPLTTPTPDYMDTAYVNSNNPDSGTTANFFFNDSYTLKSGDIVTVTGGDFTRTTTVADIHVTDVDVENDIVSGTAGNGITSVNVRVWGVPFEMQRDADVINGVWNADFSVPSQDFGVYDIKPGDNGVVRWFEGDGDFTTDYWEVPNPTFGVRANDDRAEGWQWPLGATITLEINDPGTQENPDYTDSTTVVVAEWDPNQTWFNIEFAGLYNLKTGDLVTVSDGSTTKQHTVVNLSFTQIDTDTDQVFGTANPDQLVNIWTCSDNDPCVNRDETADQNGGWSTNFSIPGEQDWEQDTANLQAGSWIDSSVNDEDGDSTMYGITVDWVAPASIPLVFAISNPVDLSVPRATVENINVLNALNDTLFRIDQNGDIQPLAASSYTVSPDGLVYTVTMRSGALWSDGVPVTSQHYVNGILRVLDPNVGSDYGFVFFPIHNAQAFNNGDITNLTLVGITALNTQTIQFTLEQPTSHFPLIMASPAALPVRQDVLDQFGESWTSPAHYVSNGLYKLSEYDNAHIVIEQNPLYNGPVTASFSQMAFDVIPDPNEQIASYKNENVDVLLSTPIATIMGDPELRTDLTILPSPGFNYIGFNSQVFPTNDPLVRKALSASIDRQTIINDILMTPWRVEANGVIPPELPGYQGSSVGYSYNPQQAQTFLADAGYPGGNGFPVLNLIAHPANFDILEEIAVQWESVLGITVNIDYFTYGERFDILAQCRNNPTACAYNGFLWGWAVDYPDAYNILNDLFHPDASYNFTQWDNINYRNLLDLAVSELDPVQRIGYLQQAQEILVEQDAAIAPLFHIDGALVIRPGIYPYYSPTFFTNLAYWSNVDPTGDGMAAAVVDSGGGIIATDNNTVTVNVPAGALQNEVTLSVTDLGGNYQITASQEELNVLTSYSIQPHGLQFATPVTLTIAWIDSDNDGEVDDTSQLEANIYLRKDGQAITPACNVNPNCDMNTNILTVEVTSLSRFELVVPVNQPPTDVVITAPVDPVNIADFVTVNVDFSDPEDNNAHDVTFDWGDGTSTNTSATGSTSVALHQYQSAGVYTITATVTDSYGQSAQAAYQYVVAYDPDGGFVTGGGWINSPLGAYTPDPTLTGKATFGFVSKYQKGAKAPTGNTEFQFKVAGLNFKSTSDDWLVIAGSKAKYKGTGTINGAGEYGFMLSAIDGAPDLFRIKIWDMATGVVIYDNQLGASDDADPSTQIGGGSIVVHKAK